MLSRGFTDPLLEYKLTCQDPKRHAGPHPLDRNAHALTCFGGVCYILVH
jgi:hypothetical protein